MTVYQSLCRAYPDHKPHDYATVEAIHATLQRLYPGRTPSNPRWIEQQLSLWGVPPLGEDEQGRKCYTTSVVAFLGMVVRAENRPDDEPETETETQADDDPTFPRLAVA